MPADRTSASTAMLDVTASCRPAFRNCGPAPHKRGAGFAALLRKGPFGALHFFVSTKLNIQLRGKAGSTRRDAEKPV